MIAYKIIRRFAPERDGIMSAVRFQLNQTDTTVDLDISSRRKWGNDTEGAGI